MGFERCFTIFAAVPTVHQARKLVEPLQDNPHPAPLPKERGSCSLQWENQQKKDRKAVMVNSLRVRVEYAQSYIIKMY